MCMFQVSLEIDNFFDNFFRFFAPFNAKKPIPGTIGRRPITSPIIGLLSNRRLTVAVSRLLLQPPFLRPALVPMVKPSPYAGRKNPGPGSVSNHPPQENTAPTPRALPPTPARRPAGRGQGKGANPSRPLPLRFPPEQKNSGVPAARVFSIRRKQLHRPF